MKGPGKTLAIASLALGVMSLPTAGCLGVGALVAIALGVSSLVRSRREPAADNGESWRSPESSQQSFRWRRPYRSGSSPMSGTNRPTSSRTSASSRSGPSRRRASRTRSLRGGSLLHRRRPRQSLAGSSVLAAVRAAAAAASSSAAASGPSVVWSGIAEGAPRTGAAGCRGGPTTSGEHTPAGRRRDSRAQEAQARRPGLPGHRPPGARPGDRDPRMHDRSRRHGAGGEGAARGSRCSTNPPSRR